MQVVGEHIEPVGKTPLVEQIGLAVEQLLDLVLEAEIGEVARLAHSAASRTAAGFALPPISASQPAPSR